jgi:retinol dehydrogenase 12
VTGANTGIGRVTAHELARRGDRVILACRSEEKARSAITAIVDDTGNTAVEFLALDLGNLDSVRRAARTLLERKVELDVLVANAGLAGQRGLTAQGFELAFGTNHLGHFLLVTSLLPSLGHGRPSRVVVVASDSHYDAKGIDWNAVRSPTRTRTGLAEYSVSKLSNVLFAQELARRVPRDDVWVCSLHPGVIASDVWRGVPWPVRPVMKRFMKSPQKGAETTLLCATGQDVLEHRGAYYSEGRLKEPSGYASPALGRKLWELSEEWTR